VSQPVPPFRQPPGHQPAGADDEVITTLLAVAFPEFWIGPVTHRSRPARWAAARKDAAAPGLHALIADLDTLQAALLWNQALTCGQIPLGPI